jgi:hypothetical protein
MGLHRIADPQTLFNRGKKTSYRVVSAGAGAAPASCKIRDEACRATAAIGGELHQS